MDKKYSRETLCVQAGWTPKKGEPRVLPIYQSTTFKYDTSEQMARLFDLEDSGYFYTRLQNPTNDAVAAKIAAPRTRMRAGRFSDRDPASQTRRRVVPLCRDAIRMGTPCRDCRIESLRNRHSGRQRDALPQSSLRYVPDSIPGSFPEEHEALLLPCGALSACDQHSVG